MDELAYSAFLWYLLRSIPFILGIGSILYLLSIRKRKPIESILILSHGLSIMMLVIGVLITWRSAYEIWIIAGAASYITIDMMYQGWIRSWESLYVSGFFAIVLYAITVVVYLEKRRKVKS